MSDLVRLTYLYDFYGELLKTEQREIFYSFVFEDLSLQEIADEYGVTRQAVHDKVQRGIHTMEDYEKKLGLIDKYLFFDKSFTILKERIKEVLSEDSPLIEEIELSLDKILEVF